MFLLPRCSDTASGRRGNDDGIARCERSAGGSGQFLGCAVSAAYDIAAGITSLAAPHLEVNGLPVIVHASHWLSVVWTLAWMVVLVWLTTVGLKRRQL